jgi:hypothetical protein
VDNLVKRIADLSPEDAMEAALALQSQFGDAATDTESAYVAAVKEDKFAHQAEVGDLARSVLLVGANDPELRDSVEEAVEAVGQSQFVFGGAEIFALAALGVYVFNSIQAGGKASQKKKTSVKPDGTVITDEETVWLVGSGVFRKLFALASHGSGG